MPRFDAILFDFDGVLLDSEPLHCQAWAEVLAPFGIRLDWEFYRERYVGMDDRVMLREIGAAATPPIDWHELWAQYPRKKELFRSYMDRPPFLPELDSLLRRLHPEYKLAVVSSSARIEIQPTLETGGLASYFDVLITGEDVENHKPAPDPYLLAARVTGARSPLVVEDSPPGIASARAAGFEVLAVKSAAEMPASLQLLL
jgi:beta-phosphoglucomutase